MIKVNGQIVETGHFPDGTLLMKWNGKKNNVSTITWQYESDAELFALYSLKKHIDRVAPGYNDFLYLPYIPNARQDRVKTEQDVFTLKYFAEIINSLKFKQVFVLDPHSSVSEALINNVVVVSPKDLINLTLDNIGTDNLLMFYPDEGAMKRYSGMTEKEYAFGIKKRDWATGKIEGLDVAGCTDKIKDSKILIIDDICSRGGTFYHSAKKLKELGAKEIYLYVTHCENTILDGEVLTSGLVEKVYTTNSIFTKEHEKIEVFEL
jgi:ribose-phosphate pyrophosphokinase